MVRAGAALVVLAAWLGSWRPAHACSQVLPSIDSRRVVPSDGAIAVPINTRIFVEYGLRAYAVSASLELRAAGGATVPSSTTVTGATWQQTGVLTPDAPLAPGTTYEVLDSTVVPCDPDGMSCLGSPSVIATFTTGPVADTEPPVPSGVAVASTYVSTTGSTCDYDADYIVHVVTAGGVDHASTRWMYYDASGAEVAGPLPLLTVGHDCGGEAFAPSYQLRIATDTFSIRAVDISGNLEPTAHVLVGESCVDAAPPLDAGVSADAASAAENDGAAAGCCSTSGNHATSMLFLLALLTCARSAWCCARRRA